MSKDNRDMSIEEKFQKWLKSEYQGFHSSNESDLMRRIRLLIKNGKIHMGMTAMHPSLRRDWGFR